MINASNLINFGTSGLNVGDITYSAYPLSAPAYLPLNNESTTYLSASYPALAAIYAAKTVSYSTATGLAPNYDRFVYSGKTYLGYSSYNNYGIYSASTDGENWYSSTVPTPYFDTTNRGNNRFGQMAYGNGKIVALYTPNSTLITTVQAAPYNSVYNWGANMVSADGGLTWQFGNLNPLITYYSQVSNWQKIIFTGSYFIVTTSSINYGGLYYIMYSTSTDGISWTDPIYEILRMNYSPNYQVLVPGNNGGFIYIGANTANNQIRMGNNLGQTGSGFTNASPYSGAYGAGLFVVLCNNSGTAAGNVATNEYFTSPTGFTWTARTLPATLFWQSIAYTSGYFLAIGYSSASSITTAYTSTDGINWTAQSIPIINQNNTIGTIAGGNGKFIYYNNSTASTVTVNLSTAGSTFSLPYVNANQGIQAYIKAT